MRDQKESQKESQKQKRIVKRQLKILEKANTMPNKAVSSGNKRIEVQKYKDEGVKNRTVIDMKKNNQYKENFVAKNAKAIKSAIDFMSNLKSSTFKNMPKQVFDNANSSKNTQIDGKMSESKPLTTPEKKLINIPSEILKGTLDDMSTDGGFKTTKTTGKAIPQLKSKLTIIKKNKK